MWTIFSQSFGAPVGISGSRMVCGGLTTQFMVMTEHTGFYTCVFRQQ